MKLEIIEQAHQFALAIYRETTAFPDHEIYGLTSQLRRAVVSIPSNISEGKARGSDKEFHRFLLIARGSLEEVKYQMRLANDLNYMNSGSYTMLTRESEKLGRSLNGLIFTIAKHASALR